MCARFSGFFANRRFASLIVGVAIAGCVSDSGHSGIDPASFTAGQVTEVVAGATAAVPAGECRMVEQTVWVTATVPITLTASQWLGPNKDSLACEIAQRDARRDGQAHCVTRYGNDGTHRNSVLLAPPPGGISNCRCREGFDQTRCEVTLEAQCGFEVLRTQAVQVCG